jgi:hypothetical protein
MLEEKVFKIEIICSFCSSSFLRQLGVGRLRINNLSHFCFQGGPAKSSRTITHPAGYQFKLEAGVKAEYVFSSHIRILVLQIVFHGEGTMTQV